MYPQAIIGCCDLKVLAGRLLTRERIHEVTACQGRVCLSVCTIDPTR